MPDEDINYVAEVLQSQTNYAFIGIMCFLMLVVNFLGFGALLLAGEIACLFIAQNSRIQRIIRARKNKDKILEIEEAEVTIVKMLPQNYQMDFHSVRTLCEEIERKSNELGRSNAQVMLANLIEKLSSFRYDYARMLRAHHLLSTRNYRNLQTSLTSEIARAEQAVEREESAQVRHALNQNLSILKQRLGRIKKLEELVRLLEARLQVIKNSLSLIQDEVYSFTDVTGISGLVDTLLTNLSLSDEFRSAYEEVLSAESNFSRLSDFEESSLDSAATASLPQAVDLPSAKSRNTRDQIRRVK